MAEPKDRASLFQKDHLAVPQGPVECLGMTFASEDARRSHFLERLKEKLPELSQRHDFPLGEDEDILRLSDPPYYTACPNPFLTDFVTFHGRPYDPDEPYSREPFAVDVSVGKTDPLYRAHGYHTKVPHLAIVPSILHYTKPGDIVLDGFLRLWHDRRRGAVVRHGTPCVPARSRTALEGGRPSAAGVGRPAGDSWRSIPSGHLHRRQLQHPLRCRCVHNRRAAATRRGGRRNWLDVRNPAHRMGRPRDGSTTRCGARCSRARNAPGRSCFSKRRSTRRRSGPDPGFPVRIARRNWARITCNDHSRRALIRRRERLGNEFASEPALINYSVGNSRYEKEPDQTDLSILERIGDLPLPSSIPTNAFPIEDMYHGSRLAPKGFMNVHHMFLPRAAHALAALWRRTVNFGSHRLRNILLFFVEQAIWGMSVLNR